MKTRKSLTTFIAFIAFAVTTFAQDPGMFDTPDMDPLPNQCGDPANLTAIGITTSTADLSWTSPDGLIPWEIEVIPATKFPTGLGVVYNDSLPYVVTGLLPATEYVYYVRSSCGIVSNWIGPYQFTTSPILYNTQTLCTKTIQPYSVNVGDATHNGSTYSWSISPAQPNAIISGNGSNTITIDWTNAPNGTYTLQAIETSIDGCVSTAVTATIILSATPTAPVSPATQTFCNAATVSDLNATGTYLQWYDVATGGTALANTTTLVTGTTYYVSQTTETCESSRAPLVVTINSQPLKPNTACYQTATFNTNTCQWDVTGTQPLRPTTACYETATFNTTSCQWDVAGNQPVRPITACYETATFNTTSCQWDVTGTQPLRPTTACYETATFNTTSCQWDVAGTQPLRPTTACYQTAIFNTTSCQWDVAGTQPLRPTTACYQTATFNTTSCQWNVTGSQPLRPTTACYQTSTFNTTKCQWDVIGTQPSTPSVSCIDNCNGTWTLTASRYTGSLIWNTGATTPILIVNSIGIYSVKQIINGCDSPITTVSVFKTCLTGNADIFHTETTCNDYKQNAIGKLLNNLNYSATSNKIKTVTPEVFLYYTSVVAPSSKFTIKVTETKATSIPANQFKLMSIQASNQIVLWNPNCNKLCNVGVRSGANNSQGSLTITNAVPGATYVLSVKYETKSLQGDAFTGSNAPKVTYSFSTSIDNLNDGIANNYILLPNSQTSIDLVSGCSVISSVAKTSQTTQVMTSSFNVYPVPFKDELYVKYNLEKDTNVLIEIYDIRGVLLQKEYDTNGYDEKEIKLNVNFLRKSGQVYFLRVTTDKGSEIKKIISIIE